MKCTIVFLSIVLFFASSLLYAEEQSGLCENLAKFSCAPGLQDDGTGTAISLSGLNSKNQLINTFESKKEVVESKFRNMLMNSEDNYLKKLVLSSLGLADSPDCNSKKQSSIDKCTDDAVSGLTHLAKRQFVTSIDIEQPKQSNDQEVDLSELFLLTQNITYKKTFAEIEKEFPEDNSYIEAEKKIKDKVFPKVKSILIKKISSLPIEEKTKTFMIEKVNAIRTSDEICSKKSTNLANNFIPNAYYRPESQVFKLCNGLLTKNPSEFMLVGILAHELSHSIDPCNITRGPESETVKYKNKDDLAKMDAEYPVQGLVSCLRLEKSVNAINSKSPSKNDGTLYAPTDFPATGKDPKFSYCNKADQIGEAVSDWLATEVITDYIQDQHPNLTREQWQTGFSNVFRPICSTDNNQKNKYVQSSSSEFHEHPDLNLRINAILLVNPQVRSKMGCLKEHSKYVYCDAKNPEKLLKFISEEKAKSEVIGPNNLTSWVLSQPSLPGGGIGNPTTLPKGSNK